MNNSKKVKGIRSFILFIPTIILIISLHVVIIISTLFINILSLDYSNEVQNQNDSISELTKIISSYSKMSDTAISFTHTPQIPNGSINTGPLNAYYEVIKNDEYKPDVIRNKLDELYIPNDAKEDINAALDNYASILNDQAHALRLINIHINLGDEFLEKLLPYELSENELNYTKEEALNNAEMLLFSREYANYKVNLTTSVSNANSIITKSSIEKQNDIDMGLKWLRGLLWGSITIIALVNIIFFFLLIKLLILPIINFSKKIDSNEHLNAKKTLYEAKRLAIAYNALLDRHNEFENELRMVAEIDSLTNLPNRYCYNEFLSNPVTKSSSVCVFLFDINNLKYVNDTLGHSEGDNLIMNAAKCIKKCFLNEKKNNCFRIGGDEFVSIKDDIKFEDIEKILTEFKELQALYGISIAVGYEYTDDISSIGFERLIQCADEKMYVNKKEIKEKLK